MLKTVVLLNIFEETVLDSLKDFPFIFDESNSFLLNKSIHFLLTTKR